MSQTQIYLHNEHVSEFGTRKNGNGEIYMIPTRKYLDIQDYRIDSPGIRFILDGIQFRNFEHPHSIFETFTTRRKI